MTRTGARDEPTATFDVLLRSIGPAPAAVARAIRIASIPTGRLVTSAQARGLVDSAPGPVIENVDEVQAARLEVAMLAAGAACEIVRHRTHRPPYVID